MESISLLDLLLLKIQPRYLYRGRFMQNVADISVSMLHLASPKDHAWKFMDYLLLKKSSTLKYRGTVKQLKMLGEFSPKDLIFEIIKGVSDRPVNPGDIVRVDKKDLVYLADAPLTE